jgi:hypothetical protein
MKYPVDMGRRPTTPEGAKAISARLPSSLQVGVHQLILDRWRKTGVKPSQNQLFIEALRDYLKRCGVNISQIEEDVENWTPKRERVPKIAKFPRKRRN